MIRMLLVMLLISLMVVVAMQIARSARTANVDWTGISIAIAFVAMAFYLRSVTGIG